jgi:hypothetical protein
MDTASGPACVRSSVRSPKLNVELVPTHSQRRVVHVLCKLSEMIGPSDGFDPSGLEPSQGTFLNAGCLSMCRAESRCLGQLTPSPCPPFLCLSKVQVGLFGLLTMIMNVRVRLATRKGYHIGICACARKQRLISIRRCSRNSLWCVLVNDLFAGLKKPTFADLKTHPVPCKS